MNLPDRIFTLGGAGKAIGVTLLESEWVLREVLQPRENPQQLTVTILDTAEGEENFDQERLRDVRERIAEVKAELREDHDTDRGRIGDITIQYKLVTEGIQLNSSIDLTGDKAVPRITSGNGMKEEDWWLGGEHVNENLDFARGVVRKRGLGKAIYYKAYAEDDQISTYIDLPSKGEVALIAGLGGGTGSGIVIDIAKDLQEKMPTAEITLFGVLPNHTEGIKESTNAFAALSELEYLSLTDNDVFKDRILLPIDPTGFDGKKGNRIQTGQLLEEFDEALIYLISAYYNNQQMEDIFEGAPDYAPFTIGIPQVLRYNVEAINEARQTFREILETKQDALEAEEDLYEELEIFLENHYDQGEGGLRDLDEADLTNRLERLRSLLDFDLFEELEYESLSLFEEIVSDAREEADDIGDQIEIIDGSLRAGVADPDDQTTTFRDDVDAHLAEVLRHDLEMIAWRKQLLERKGAIDNNRIRATLEYLIGAEDGRSSAGGKIRRLESQLDDLREKRDRLEGELEETIDELEQLREEQSEEITNRVSKWEREVAEELDQLQAIDRGQVETELDQLLTALERYAGNIAQAESEDEVDNVTQQEVVEALNSVEAALGGTGVRFEEEKRDVNASLTELRDAKKAFIKSNQEEGTLDKLTPWESSVEEERKEAQKNFRMQKNRLDDKGVLAARQTGEQLSVEVEFTIDTVLDAVDRREDELRNEVVNELRGALEESPAEEDIEQLRDELERDDVDRETCREIVRTAFERELEGTAELEEQRSELEERLEDVESDIDLYEATTDLFQALNSRRSTQSEYESEFQTRLSDYDDGSDQAFSSESEDYVYVKNVKPAEVFRATGNTDIAETGLVSHPEESQRVRSNLEELADNVLNQQYSGIKRRSLSREGRRYEDMKVRLAVMSRAVTQIDSEALDFEEKFLEAFDVGSGVQNPYSSWAPEFGDSWDIAMSVFINGVFLDNLRKAVQADGYHSGYKQREQELGDDILIHHSYGLEDGYYVRRKGLLNVEDTEDIDFLLRDDQEVVDDLLEDYVETVPTHPAEAEATASEGETGTGDPEDEDETEATTEGGE